ncbi:hypothetical protein AWB73_06615 [Caballeronia turbans]|jgi:hypothetical protein|uniref:hypothetical protein n=1 Tax=unclassified Caballeronia TaxID=2646786 RepID=UPI00074BC926|nr:MULTISPECIES: hypothetical protein [unclassified Caballeronia]SAL59517.1 hypothetical protein AWB73_06615 [Caballeronia turbans]
MAEALQGETPTEYPIPFVPEHLKDREAAKRVVLEQTVPLNSVGDLVTHLF